MNPIVSAEEDRKILGVPGRYLGATVGGRGYRPGTFTVQRWVSSRRILYYGTAATIKVEIRFDDECRNGHNTFSITGEIRDLGKRGDSGFIAGGMIPEDICGHFPELSQLLRWHGCTSDGPLHYVQNTVFLAGNRDCWGRKAGDPESFETAIYFGTSPVGIRLSPRFAGWLQEADRSDCEVLRIDHERERDKFDPKFTLGAFGQKWYECPFDTEREALEFLEGLGGPHRFERVATSFSKGKERELDAAREAAIWPDATDEQISAPPEELRAALIDRLPALLEEFRGVVDACGFVWAPSED